jgi:hypothetical protein
MHVDYAGMNHSQMTYLGFNGLAGMAAGFVILGVVA